jgi:hypothetical protein
MWVPSRPTNPHRLALAVVDAESDVAAALPPVAGLRRPIETTAPLRDDAFTAELARLGEHERPRL